MIDGLELAMTQLKAAGCRTIYINGSFVTSESEPNDFDACYEIVVENLNKLPDALIKARIAAKMSEKELAEMLGIDEQRIKEHEAKSYQSASFLELLEISFA